MHSNRLLRRAAPPVLLGLLVASASAQDPPFNATLLSQWNQVTSYGDVWGDGNFLYQGHYGMDMVSILDISDPYNPVLAATVIAGGANAQASAQDVKVGDGLLFVALERDDPDGALIVDVRDPYNPVVLTTVDPEPGSYEQIHNLFYDQGWLYLVNSSDNTIAIVDLRTYDPDNAPGSIGSTAYRITGVGGTFVHDITVQNGILYCAAWDSLYLYDVSNLGQQAPQYITKEYGSNCHAVWASDDGKFVLTGEEHKGGALRLYEVVQNGSTVDLIQRDSVVQRTMDSFSAHNMLVRGNRVYTSWYQAGGVVLELDREHKELDLVAQYDTDGGVVFGFGGCWGIYPFLGEEQVLLSDLGRGSFLLDMSALEIDVPVLPDTVPTDAPLTFDFSVAGLGNAVLDPNAVSILCSVGGGPFEAQPALYLGGDQFQATLPVAGCQGDVTFYVAATDTLGRTFHDPGIAPAKVYTVYTADALVPVFSDDFETDKGWSVYGDADTGNFVRVTPLGTLSKPNEDDPDAVGTMCYLTGQAGGNGDDGYLYDLDNGMTSITTPTFDMSAGDGLISFSYYFFNGTADADKMLVEISNDAGSSWVEVQRVVRGAGGWKRSLSRVSDVIQPTSQMQVRITVDDLGGAPSTTDLAIDEFYAYVFSCDTNASATPRNGSGLNPSCLSTNSLPVLGTSWAASVDGAALPTATLTYLVSYVAPSSGLFLGAGELLVDVTSNFFFATTSLVDGSGDSVHVIEWPNDPSLVGATPSAQALLVGSGLQLCNALDLNLDQ